MNLIQQIKKTQAYVNYSRILPYVKPYWFRALMAMLICIPIGSQKFSFANYNDAIDAFLLLLNWDNAPKYNIYNVGNNKQYSILEIAESIKKKLPLSIELDKKDIKLNVQMDSTRFMQEFNWKPKHKLDDTIMEIINKIKSN